MKSIQMADEKKQQKKPHHLRSGRGGVGAAGWGQRGGSLFVWMYVGALMQKKEAGRDLLFHLFLRINYAEMLIGGAL